jgi:hypothetical protein
MQVFFSPGSIVAVRQGPVTHVGIVTEWQTVISSKPQKGIHEETMADFSGGLAVECQGYPGSLPAAVVIYRARSRIGEQWNLVKWNCEHFVRYAHGVEEKSPQLQVFGKMVLACCVVGFFFAAAKAA